MKSIRIFSFYFGSNLRQHNINMIIISQHLTCQFTNNPHWAYLQSTMDDYRSNIWTKTALLNKLSLGKQIMCIPLVVHGRRRPWDKNKEEETNAVLLLAEFDVDILIYYTVESSTLTKDYFSFFAGLLYNYLSKGGLSGICPARTLVCPAGRIWRPGRKDLKFRTRPSW